MPRQEYEKPACTDCMCWRGVMSPAVLHTRNLRRQGRVGTVTWWEDDTEPPSWADIERWRWAGTDWAVRKTRSQWSQLPEYN